ncbi:MAG: oligosaccharide flippase family protein [Lachnospiraceae bacterium]|nr:oligosaccharide flippase family protein [Lachnospiraceae bacterium]
MSQVNEGEKNNTAGMKAVKSGIWYTIASISIRAVAIITTPIYTGMLSTGDYGIANTFNTWIELINIITCLCVVYSIGRAKIDFKEKFDEYLSALQGLSSSFAFIVLIFAVIFREQLSYLIEYEVPLVIVLFSYLCVSPSVEYTLQKTRYEYRYKENILISVITCIGTVICSVTLILFFNDKRYVGKILGTLLPTFLMGIFFYIRILKAGKKFYVKEYWEYALKIGLPMIPHAFALVVLAQVDRLMIKDICSDSDVGLYTFGYSFATLLSIFTNAIGQAWLPWFNEQLDMGNRERIRSINKKIIMLGGFFTIGFITVAPEALMLLSPSSPPYWIARYVVPPVALGTFAQYLYTNYVNVELFYKKTPIIAVSSCFAAVINYLLNLIAIPRFGYTAAAYTTFISYVILMTFHFVAVRFIIKERVYDSVFYYLILIIITVFGLSLICFYSDDIRIRIFRYLYTLIVLGVFAFIKKDDIMLLVDYVKKRFLKKER